MIHNHNPPKWMTAILTDKPRCHTLATAFIPEQKNWCLVSWLKQVRLDSLEAKDEKSHIKL